MVNINDFEVEGRIPENVLKEIHEKQNELMMKYKEIEGLPDWPLNVNLAKHQIIIKDFKQRILEEMAEGYEAFLESDNEHFFEEMIDGLHFATELNLLTGKNFDFFEDFDKIEISPKHKCFPEMFWDVGYKYGLLMNTLKNKPWKQSEIETDKNKFFRLLKESYESYLRLLKFIGLTKETMYCYYFKKNKVNQFRQRSKY